MGFLQLIFFVCLDLCSAPCPCVLFLRSSPLSFSHPFLRFSTSLLALSLPSDSSGKGTVFTQVAVFAETWEFLLTYLCRYCIQIEPSGEVVWCLSGPDFMMQFV